MFIEYGSTVLTNEPDGNFVVASDIGTDGKLVRFLAYEMLYHQVLMQEITDPSEGCVCGRLGCPWHGQSHWS